VSTGRWTGDALGPLWTGGTLDPPWTRAEVVAKAHRCSRARDLAVVARGAREGDGNPYPGWHEATEGLDWSGVGEERRWWSKLDEKVLRRGGEGRRRAVSAVC
jgi:hypothetical protein